jgi:L,D-peptidoglycan transpeptidase YkuD (ErfK/YbiS/YcfS/YnhG family)
MRMRHAPSLKRLILDRVTVQWVPGTPHRGRLWAGGVMFACALGRSGIRQIKRERDGATPVGRYRGLAGFWRADRLMRPRGFLPLAPIAEAAGWCDDPGDRNYNKPVLLPYPAGAESMRRKDGLYDIVVDLAWNRGPIRKGRGSAIFLHVAAADYGPTEGCIALSRTDLRKLLARIGPRTVFEVRR